MSLKCPKCGSHVSAWELTRFLRLLSVSCPRCQILLELDGRGRAALVGGYLTAVPLGIALNALLGYAMGLSVAIVIGFAVSILAASRWGTLRISAENTEG